jgi:hypothetical protein
MTKSRKGKILRVKQGYNPNSSSIGSIVFAIPTMLLVSSAIFGAATTIIFSSYLKKTTDNENREDKAISKEQDE